MSADYSARADIVSLQARMDLVTQFLAEQFPNKWGRPPADGCDGTNCRIPAAHRAVTDAEFDAAWDAFTDAYPHWLQSSSAGALHAALEAFVRARQDRP